MPIVIRILLVIKLSKRQQASVNLKKHVFFLLNLVDSNTVLSSILLLNCRMFFYIVYVIFLLKKKFDSF